MFSRNISIDDVKEGILNGKIIKSYPDDVPFPSFLVFKMISQRPA